MKKFMLFFFGVFVLFFCNLCRNFENLNFFDILGTLLRLMKTISRNYISCVVKVNQFANYVQINI
jgi:hypothetical protein